MLTYLSSGVFIFVFTVIATYLFIKIAHKIKCIDIPKERSSHRKTTPTGGGFIFTSIVLIYFLINDLTFVEEYIWVYISILIIMLLGLFDDIKNFKPKLKFTIIFFTVILLYIHDIQITYLGTYLGFDINLNTSFAFLFTLFIITSFINAINLVDGQDGLAASISIVILSSFLFIGISYSDHFIIMLSSSFIASLLAFLLFNWSPAKIFMGDSGSLTLGFIIALLAIKALAYINPTSLLFITAIPLIDITITVIRRKQRGLPLFAADRNHMHYVLFNQKQDTQFVVILLSMLQIIMCIIGYISIGKDDLLNLILFCLFVIVFFQIFDPRLRKRKKSKKSKKIASV